MEIVEPRIKHKDEFAEMILWVIARYYQVSTEQICRKDKKDEISEARNLCYHFIRLYTKLTFAAIGEIMDRDHATVLQANAKIEGYIEIKSRHIFSRYLTVKYLIDEMVRLKYPKTFGFRISTFTHRESLT